MTIHDGLAGTLALLYPVGGNAPVDFVQTTIAPASTDGNKAVIPAPPTNLPLIAEAFLFCKILVRPHSPE